MTALLRLAAWWFGALVTLPAAAAPAAEFDALLQQAAGAEQQLDTRRALDLLLAAEKLRPDHAPLLQKIARQYSDLVVDLPTTEAKRESARQALAYAQRAVALAPRDAVNVLSVAISHGKLATYSDTHEKVALSRQVREEAERALQLDPNYAWAHHVLGRWHHEVAALGSTARLFVRIFHGGLPGASVADAIRHLRRAVELESGELQHHLELGFAYLANQETAAARAAWQRGLALPSRAKHDEPAKERARAALAKLG